MSIAQQLEEFNKLEKRAVTADVQPEEWYLPSKVGYTKWVEKTFHSIHAKETHAPTESCDCKSEHCEVKVQKLQLFPHQRFVRDYMQHKSPYRGLLLLHGLGTGKSCTSIAAAEMLMNQKDVIVMLPASLRSNYINEVRLCGHKHYTPRQYWKHIPLASINDADVDIKYVDPKMIKKHKGLWVPIPGRHPNFDKLSGVQQQQVVDQINHIIERRYNFINYNGIQRQHLNELTKDGAINPFDHKVVIIDEVHNFISRVIGRKGSGGSTLGKSPISKQLYNLIMKADNVKVILLSGTPMINYAHEIAFLVNLIKGFTKVYEVPFKVPAASKHTPDTIHDLLQQHPRVEAVRIDTKRNIAELRLVPGAFVKGNRAGHVIHQQLFKDDHAILEDITQAMAKEKIKLALKYKTKYYTPLPIDDAQFNDLFINEEKGEIRNPQLFMRRILGTVSYFKASNEDLYPSIRKVETVKVPLSEYQFVKYTEARNEERENERKRSRFDGGQDDSGISVFKAYSRAICNFAFPEEIKRPYPSKIAMMLKEEMDDFDDDTHAVLNKDDDETKVDKVKEYQKALAIAMDALHANMDEYLKKNLAKYSPKYAAFVKNLEASPGHAMVYSQFRNVEGLGVLQHVLQAHGYAEFKLKKNKSSKLYELDIADEDLYKPKYAVFTGDKEMTEAILSVYNSDTAKMPANIRDRLEQLYPDGSFNLRGNIIKLLMITQSGAEGISLKNVRQVHVLEPYWNQIRVDQVIGRAVRTCSHVALPPADRNVDVYIYVATFTPKQLADNFTIRRVDRSMTSDESIVGVAERKNKIITGLLKLMKQAAVDCQLNQPKRQRALESLTCFSFPVNVDDDANAMTVDIVDEPQDKDVVGQQEKEVFKPKKVLIKGKPYIYLSTTKELFDYELYATFGSLKLVGYLEILEKGVYKVKMIKSR